MTMTNFHYPCSHKGCKERIGEKAHEWCVRKGVKNLCWYHSPERTIKKLYEKTNGTT